MKKLIVAAMMVLGTTSAFAGDSDALKAVLKAKTYAEAEALVKQNLGQLADNAEKAKAYNKLVDLGMKAFNDQQSIQQTNQIMKKNDPVDERQHHNRLPGRRGPFDHHELLPVSGLDGFCCLHGSPHLDRPSGLPGRIHG